MCFQLPSVTLETSPNVDPAAAVAYSSSDSQFGGSSQKRNAAMSHKLALIIVAIGFATANAVVCQAQVEQGAISGKVVDPSGASVPKAKVTATNTATQAVFSTETTEDGNYRLPYLTAG